MSGRRLILVVVCCVLCVVVVVVVVTSPFSYLTDRNARSGQPQWPIYHLSALITKDASLDAPNVRGCSKLSLSLDFEHVWTFGLKRDI